ncbi:MAG TPA: hypothetical protein VER75_01775 [Thermoleophilaceae bacterium]|nr:hypothetical protein [Thermoleophilaceae bacterium]
MGRTPAPVAIHRLSPAEQRVLACFLSGRLAAGQVHAELAQARLPAQAPPAIPAQTPVQPAPTPAVAA